MNLEKLREYFDEFDKDNPSYIDLIELKTILDKFEYVFTNLEVITLL